jgi:TonB-linked SusC/RagA family outer membrane protein
MRFNIFLGKYLIISILILSLGLITEMNGQEQTDRNSKSVSISLTVMDEQGVPVRDACVKIGGIVWGYTGPDGQISIESPGQASVIITKTGYADNETRVEQLTGDQVIRLKNQGLYLASGDEVPMPFMTVKKRHSTSSSYVVKSEDLEKYPTIDVRNSFTGLAPGLQVKEMNGAPGLQAEEQWGSFGISEKIRLYTRGRSPIYIIDDVPTDVTEMQIDQHEIESATIIKDIAGKAMYGPQAADGIIFIRTKHGIANQNLLKINLETGLNVVDRFPSWTLGADYATLNNMARTNSGIEPIYSASDISAYAGNNGYDLYHPSSDYRDMMLKNTMGMRKANFSYEGGRPGLRYFTLLGYSGQDDLYKIGSTADYNRLNARSNIDISINEYVSFQLNFFGGLTFRRSPNYGYDPQYGTDASSDATMDILEFSRVISDINTISPIAFPVHAYYDIENDIPWYGVDPVFTNNPIGRLTDNGYYTETGRSGASNFTLGYDMKKILKGLRSKTFISFDVLNLVRIGKAEQYMAYNVIPSTTASGADTILLTRVHDVVSMAGQAKLHDYYYQRFGVYQSFSFDRSIGSNSMLQSSVTYYFSSVNRNQVTQPQRQQNAVLSCLYTHNDKYSVHGVLNFSGSSSLPQNNRYALFPSIGAGWVVSDESFLSGLTFINYLKLRGEAGILGYEGFSSPFYYEDLWTYNTSGGSTGAAPTGYWFGSDLVSTIRSNISRIGNPDLTWEKRKEVTVGLDAVMFKHKLYLEVNYYNNLREGILTNLSYIIPYETGISFANNYDNYNTYRYYGIESSINYTSQLGKMKYSVGGNATVQNSKIIKYDQPNYRFGYQSRIGHPTDAYWGLTYLGKFTSDTETEVIPQLFDETLVAGDMKYKDMNEDGVVDNNDASAVGNTSPRLVYALNLKLNYRNFDLTLLADGIAFVDLPLTNLYFRNGWGDNVYSEFVRDNIGGAYPRLTYYQVSNNFQSSDFWLTKGDYFKLQNVELAYTISPGVTQRFHTKGVRLFIRGANLITITGVEYVDPESPDSGVEMYPLCRTFTTGLNLTF